jgi:hypothetical protein
LADTLSPEDKARSYTRGCLRAYIEGKKNLNWIVGIIRNSQLRGSALGQIFFELRQHGDAERYDAARTACQDHGWM